MEFKYIEPVTDLSSLSRLGPRRNTFYEEAINEFVNSGVTAAKIKFDDSRIVHIKWYTVVQQLRTKLKNRNLGNQFKVLVRSDKDTNLVSIYFFKLSFE
jgi:hypothetical protein